MAKYQDDSMKLFKHVSEMKAGDESVRSTRAQVGFEAFVLEGVYWTTEEKADFMRRTEAACREVCDWFAKKIEVRD